MIYLSWTESLWRAYLLSILHFLLRENPFVFVVVLYFMPAHLLDVSLHQTLNLSVPFLLSQEIMGEEFKMNLLSSALLSLPSVVDMTLLFFLFFFPSPQISFPDSIHFLSLRSKLCSSTSDIFSWFPANFFYFLLSFLSSLHFARDDILLLIFLGFLLEHHSFRLKSHQYNSLFLFPGSFFFWLVVSEEAWVLHTFTLFTLRFFVEGGNCYTSFPQSHFRGIPGTDSRASERHEEWHEWIEKIAKCC